MTGPLKWNLIAGEHSKNCSSEAEIGHSKVQEYSVSVHDGIAVHSVQGLLNATEHTHASLTASFA